MATNPTIKAAFEEVGIDIKALRAAAPELTTLKTTDKTSLVKAVNEVFDKNASLQTELDTLQADLGDLTIDFLAAYKAKLV